jgi:hypothetical protein
MTVVQDIGAVAGTAAAAGLPLLWILHASQARDVERLRALAGRARPRRRPRTRPAAVAALAGLLALGGVHVFGGADAPPQHSRKPKRHVATVEPGTVTVSVLNATTVPGLAAALREKAVAAGFRKGTINTFSDQQLTESVVQYAPGHRAAAKAVAGRFGIARREPVTADARALAPDAPVIVIAGADKASGA